MMDKDLKEPLDFISVDKFNDGWLTATLFEDIKYKFVLQYEENVFAAHNRIRKFKKLLAEHVGEENKDWFVVIGKSADEQDIIYTRNSYFFLKWKIADSDDFKRSIEVMYYHRPSQ